MGKVGPNETRDQGGSLSQVPLSYQGRKLTPSHVLLMAPTATWLVFGPVRLVEFSVVRPSARASVVAAGALIDLKPRFMTKRIFVSIHM